MSKNYRFGYSGALIKSNNTCIGIHKQAAEILKQNDVKIGFNEADLSLNFFGKKDFTKENLKKLKGEGKENDPVDLIKKNCIVFKPFRFIFDDDAEKIYKKLNLSFFKGKINKLKQFKLDGVESDANLVGVKNPKENIKEILSGKTVWILSDIKLGKRTISSTNPESLNNLTNEERMKCEEYVSIIKNELVDLNSMDYFKESLEL